MINLEYAVLVVTGLAWLLLVHLLVGECNAIYAGLAGVDR